MAQVDVVVNGRLYKVACENGQEDRLTQLAAYFDGQVKGLSGELGDIGETRLLLLTALQLCDELFDSRRRLLELERAGEAVDEATVGGVGRLVAEAAERVARMADRIARA